MEPALFEERKRQVNDYINSKNLGGTFFILQNELNLFDARVGLLKDKIQQLRSLVLSSFDPTLTIEKYVSRVQVMQLDLIASIFMFLEDYLTFSNLLRNDLFTLHKRIAYSNTNVVKIEVEFLRTFSNHTMVGQYLLFPEASQLTLTNEEQMLVANAMKAFANDILACISRIISFFDNYYRVYIRYKHVFSALMGNPQITSAPENNRKLVSSHIYIRDIIVDRKTKQEVSVSTYVLPTDIESVSFYEDIFNDISKSFGALLSAYLVHLFNCQNPALLGKISLSGNDVTRWNEIVEKVNFIALDRLVGVFNIHVTFKKEHYLRMLKDNIFKSEKDFLAGTDIAIT